MIQWSGVLCTLLLVTTYGVVRSLKCPTTASEWDRASRGLQCQEPNYYHCLRDESGVNTEQCLPRVWIQPQMCPEFNSRVSRVDVYQCTVTNCPTSLYWSNAVFMYPICFENGSTISPTKQGSTVATTVLEETSMFDTMTDSVAFKGDKSATDKSLPVATIVGIIVGVICVGMVGALIILMYLKRRYKKGDNEGHADGNVRSEDNKLSGNENFTKSKESIKDGYQEGHADGNVRSEDNKLSEKVKNENEINNTSELLVYVVESQKPKDQTSVPKDENSVRVLVLVLNKPINKMEMDSKAKETFGPKYHYCWTLSYYQNHKQKENVSLFPQNFDFQTVRVKEIFEMIRDVVTKNEVDINFVITMPWSVWSAQRDELSPFLDENKNQIYFKREYW
ncbi:uncharacterized protein LOC133186754 isoform X2 [Saccostrea echinata]|uniref:uncharacterized protein LOC133186754 isoform X2 n=1 Tax=Saccostrea echinata TaxID=191078 RepID=UPI002A80EC23|nr:uncharacterized protein LOC133186754 isoform X2 [Saccostrea echinata]